LAGLTFSFGAGLFDLYLIKTDASGNSGCNVFNTTTSVSSGGVVNSTATVVVADVGFDAIIAPVVNFTVTLIDTLCIVPAVPITLLSFTATPVNNKAVRLDWTTASEINTDYYIIERSQDAINYEMVADSVEAAGNSSTPLSYSLLDENPYLGTSYYLLKQVDINGAYEYYGPVAVRLEGIEIINIGPNPARNEITYGIVSWKDTEVKVNVFDVLGRKLMADKASIKKGLNQLHMDVSHLSSAMYIISVTTETGNHHTQKEFVVN